MSGQRTAVAAHLILGSREEPFLAAMLASIASVAGVLIVNDNGPDPSPHAAALAGSAFAAPGRMFVDRTPFGGFAAARNVCMRIHEEQAAGDWIAFIDADEAHGLPAARIAAALHDIPPQYDFVDGYTWHFFQSFAYYTSIERRMAFFRYRQGCRWEGDVHECLIGIDGSRIALPYVYGHYGHTLEPRRHAEKGRHYSSLGAPGGVLRADQLDGFDVAEYFKPEYPRLLHFTGQHPLAVRSTLEQLAPRLRSYHQLTERIVRAQPLNVKAINVVRKANYEIRWRGRALNGLARSLVG